jgi:hypothetical protein
MLPEQPEIAAGAKGARSLKSGDKVSLEKICACRKSYRIWYFVP